MVRGHFCRANVHLEDDFKWTALHHAAHAGQLSVVRALVDAGAKVNHESLTMATPLSRAIESSSLDVVNYLLARRANARHENLARTFISSKRDEFDMTAMFRTQFARFGLGLCLTASVQRRSNGV